MVEFYSVKLRPTHATPQSHQTVKERLLANNAQTYWVPAFVKENRFHNWLADAKARCFPFLSLRGMIGWHVVPASICVHDMN